VAVHWAAWAQKPHCVYGTVCISFVVIVVTKRPWTGVV
jgi:hypothetical protein